MSLVVPRSIYNDRAATAAEKRVVAGLIADNLVPVANATLADAFTAVAKVSLVEAETFTITDAAGAVITFEFDGVSAPADGVAGANVVVDVEGATTAADVGLIMQTAITGAGIGLTASEGTTTADVDLDADDPGAQGNRRLTESVANAGFLVSTPMVGGNDHPGFSTNNHQYVRVMAESLVGTSFDLDVYGYDKVSGKWVLVTAFSGPVTVTTNTIFRSAPILIAGLDALYFHVHTFVGVDEEAHVWANVCSFD